MTRTLRRTRIVCTLGPATASEERIKELANCGMDVARLNFSHGEHADHAANFDRVRKAADDTGRTIGIMADLQGPKIRLGRFAEGSTIWNVGEEVRITVEPCIGTHDRVSTTYDQLADDAKAGDRFLIDDGRIALDVIAIEGPDVVCRVVVGGPVSDNKGLSLPGVNVSVPALSAKDIADLEFALELGVDFVALSFVRSPHDIEPVHRVMDRLGRRVPVIAKLEKPEAVDHLKEIVAAFDAVMVARGDLGVELPLEQVPLVQKDAIQLARESAKPVIVATQMLDSMIENARPTRAEASDVANAVLDGADAVMLSGETSVGKYVFDTVSTMDRIITAVEGRSTSAPPLTLAPRTRPGVIVSAALDVAERLDAAAIVAFTQSGDTVRRLARLHTDLPLLAFTPRADVQRQLSLTWGTETFLVDPVESTDDMVEQVDRALLELGRFERGDTVVIVAGSPPNTVGSTNLVHIHRLGENDR
ncbi:pyruvate kinase [Antrihabitans sp. YC3-6]|uniref:Pyruvate kinase n=1 Tax=Antrihabitans stalagmiti TaxID=2799499 RepID=A0A934NT13_9NOCA|nr:pyruvate kinase [Antrihabitans stalagmiti]MBJ8340767.1 pyruvate kinase [Antrihabitans stalagmiti]